MRIVCVVEHVVCTRGSNVDIGNYTECVTEVQGLLLCPATTLRPF